MSKSLDLELQIQQQEAQRKAAKEKRLAEIKAKLLKTKQQVKQELDLNQDLNERVSTLSVQEHEQGSLLVSLDEEMSAIQAKLVDYEQSTRMKEDQTKMQRAYQELQRATELTDLTVLALRVTEELGRAKQNQAL